MIWTASKEARITIRFVLGTSNVAGHNSIRNGLDIVEKSKAQFRDGTPESLSLASTHPAFQRTHSLSQLFSVIVEGAKVMQIDPAIQNVVLGLVANGLTTVVAHLGSRGRLIFNDSARIRTVLGKDPDLSDIVAGAAKAITELTNSDDPQFRRRMHDFLTSPELQATVRQMYASQALPDDGKEYTDEIYQGFIAAASTFTGKESVGLKELCDPFYNALLLASKRAADMSLEMGVVSEHEKREALRCRLLIDELAAVRRILEYLSSARELNVQDVLLFEKKYRNQVAERHGYITPPNFDVARRILIDALYVAPRFVPSSDLRRAYREGMLVSRFLSALYRCVLLGNPGGGKSTFAAKLCHDLAALYPEQLIAGRQLTPILVILRDYGAHKKAHNGSILQFIEASSNSLYQVPPPVGAFEYLLLNGRVLVIFDGLDELLETHYRQEISSDIEMFCHLYPSVPVLVTSREVGYSEAPLDEAQFPAYHLAPFDRSQVNEYVTKWFAVESDLSPEDRQQKIARFLEESEIVPDLRSNPLMLALMCNIYRGENYIPRNRPDIYEKCALMLFDRWDRGRGINVQLPFESAISPAMKYLAYWIYSNDVLQSGVTEDRLVSKATEYLNERRFDDVD